MPKVSQRTRNRVHEHSAHWSVAGRSSAAGVTHSEYQEVRGVVCILMRCDRVKCDWSGWLPASELIALGLVNESILTCELGECDTHRNNATRRNN